MANHPHDWIVAASCCEGPRPRVTFADMPPRHRRDLVVVGFAAALSSAYFVTLGILLQPIPSRSLAGTVLMPHTTASLAELRDTAPVVPPGASRRPLRMRATQPRPVAEPASARGRRPLSAVQLASYRELPADGGETRPDGQAGGKRPNFLGRFFHGVLRAVQPVGMNPDFP
jgi:hypothetical protein